MDTIELGCGTAYVSAWLARRGARPVGIDLSSDQLATARRLQAEHGLDFPLIEGNAEHVPLPDASFDLAISEYGACLWADPYRWVPEAARLLRPGGRLIFLTNSTLMMLCTAGRARRARPASGSRATTSACTASSGPTRTRSSSTSATGDWIRLLRANGFQVEDLIEVRPGPDATTTFEGIVTLEWARRWPCEEIWKARKDG